MSYSEAAGCDKREINMILQVFSTFKDFAGTREASILSLYFSTITVPPELQANKANLATTPPC